MTVKTVTPALVLASALIATTAQAHETHPARLSALAALDMPDLAPARRLMADLGGPVPVRARGIDIRPAHRHTRATAEADRRAVSSRLFRWFGFGGVELPLAPCVARFSPFAGQETVCERPLPPRFQGPRSHPGPRLDLRAWLRDGERLNRGF
ncbi:MAG: hypothetical protein H6899_02550 [Rhodobacter sp.]|nr:hypothetical protein [Paracoccaceae bacterium]MCC0078837.1 hypothetical protein [Rhodobacter sp.]